MMNNKVKIVLDADVLIHFQKAGFLSLLPEIFPEYDYIVLNIVYQELRSIQKQLDKQIQLLGKISLVTFTPNMEMAQEYAILSKKFGRGESACMAYCRFTYNVLGSSNLRDISQYCKGNNITYLTTIDFLYYAYVRKKMTSEECNTFIKEVNAKGSKLPMIDISTYTCNVLL